MFWALAVMVLGPVVSMLIILSDLNFAGPAVFGFAAFIGACAPLPSLAIAAVKFARWLRFRGYRRDLRDFLGKCHRLNAF